MSSTLKIYGKNYKKKECPVSLTGAEFKVLETVLCNILLNERRFLGDFGMVLKVRTKEGEIFNIFEAVSSVEYDDERIPFSSPLPRVEIEDKTKSSAKIPAGDRRLLSDVEDNLNYLAKQHNRRYSNPFRSGQSSLWPLNSGVYTYNKGGSPEQSVLVLSDRIGKGTLYFGVAAYPRGIPFDSSWQVDSMPWSAQTEICLTVAETLIQLFKQDDGFFVRAENMMRHIEESADINRLAVYSPGFVFVRELFRVGRNEAIIKWEKNKRSSFFP